ncbi:MAG: aminotransferase class V-fold PLP-dependent enzyme [Myxococcaceae bacterium]
MREAWSLDDSVHFLNHGSFGATPKAVLARQAELRAQLEREPVRFMVRELEPLLDRAREATARFVGARPDGLVFVANATTGVNAVVQSLAFAPGDELLTTSHGYNACMNVLRHAAHRAGAGVVVADVPFPTRGDDEVVERVLSAVTSRTKLVLLDQITSPTALVFPVARLVKELEGRGVPVLVDAAHAPGQVPLALDATGASFTTGNLHKWVCTPKAAAFLHVREDWRAKIRPTVISHGANSRRTDRSRFHLEFDWVGTTDPTAMLCVPEALEVMGALVPGGWPALMAQNRADALAARDALCAGLGVTAPAPASMIASMAAVELPWGDTAKLGDELLDRYRVQVPIIPFGGRTLVRVSAQRHVRPGDVTALVDALRALRPGGAV